MQQQWLASVSCRSTAALWRELTEVGALLNMPDLLASCQIQLQGIYSCLTFVILTVVEFAIMIDVEGLVVQVKCRIGQVSVAAVE